MLLLLACCALLTSLLAALIGFGGGMLLLAVLPFFLPAAALIPLHGLAQLASNSSRALFAPRDVRWSVLPAFLLGSGLGVTVGFLLLSRLPLALLPLLIGAYMLLNLWHRGFKQLTGKAENFVLLGFIQTGLGLFVGATGPLTMTALLKQTQDQNQIIATSALLMTVSHLCKVLLFGSLGFVYSDYLWPLLAMCAGAIAGSWLGSRLRPPGQHQNYILLLKLALTLLALHLLWQGLMPLLVSYNTQ